MKFKLLVSSIEKTHHHFQRQAVKAVNISLTLRNWLIGYYIVEFEQRGEDRAMYGSKLLEKLSSRLKIKGLTSPELSRFRQFYIVYPQILGTVSQEFTKMLPVPISKKALPKKSTKKRQTPNTDKLISSLSFSHFVELLKLEESKKRTFYEVETMRSNWSVRELKRQISSLYYERSNMSRKPKLLSQKVQAQASKAESSSLIKSVYAFEFLGLKTKDAVEEQDLECALLDHLQDFMLEMGHGFCLEGRQKKILIGNEYFFVDLVFYHRILKCHVLVELKVEEFNHHNIGQLNTYLNYYKQEIQSPSDNPPIGILLVTDKNKALVHYATAGMDNQLFVSKYLLELPQKEALEQFIRKEVHKWK